MLYSKIFLSSLNEDLKPYQKNATRGLNRKRLNQVPQYAKGRGDLNSKVEQVRNGTSRHVVLSPSDLAYIRNRYNIHDVKSGKQLGTTGMTLNQDPTTGAWSLVK